MPSHRWPQTWRKRWLRSKIPTITNQANQATQSLIQPQSFSQHCFLRFVSTNFIWFLQKRVWWLGAHTRFWFRIHHKDYMLLWWGAVVAVIGFDRWHLLEWWLDLYCAKINPWLQPTLKCLMYRLLPLTNDMKVIEWTTTAINTTPIRQHESNSNCPIPITGIQIDPASLAKPYNLR